MSIKHYDDCLNLANEAHKGQHRMITGEPFITHPVAVADEFDDDSLKSVAVLHDVIEDCDLTAEDLLAFGVPKSVVDVVVVLTRVKDESYFDYIMRVIGSTKTKLVKIEDIKHNMKTTHKGSLMDKYELALYVLNRSWEI